MSIQLYLNPKDKLYYFVNDNNVLCSNCSGELVSVVFIKVVWDKLGSGVQYYCSKCISHYKSDVKATFVERFGAIITDDIGRNYEFVLLSKPVLKPVSELSIFDINSFESDKIIDKTVHAGRESFEGSSIGSLEYEDDIEPGLVEIEAQAYINPLFNDELDKLLLSHKNSIPEIEYKKQLLLEDKK